MALLKDIGGDGPSAIYAPFQISANSSSHAELRLVLCATVKMRCRDITHRSTSAGNVRGEPDEDKTEMVPLSLLGAGGTKARTMVLDLIGL